MHIVDQLIAERAERLQSRETIYRIIRPTLNKAMHYDLAVELADKVKTMSGHDAFALVSDMMKPEISVTGLENLPADSPCILISNHPTGLADGIAVFEAIKDKRPDHIYLANADALRVIPKCEDIIIPVEWVLDKRTVGKTRETLSKTRKAFKDGRCVVIFPSGKLAALTLSGIVDKPWESSAAMLAKKYNVPVIPLHIRARNSALYYFFSKTNGELRDITLFRELLNKKGQKFRMTFGPPINPNLLSKNADNATVTIRRIVEAL